MEQAATSAAEATQSSGLGISANTKPLPITRGSGLVAAALTVSCLTLLYIRAKWGTWMLLCGVFLVVGMDRTPVHISRSGRRVLALLMAITSSFWLMDNLSKLGPQARCLVAGVAVLLVTYIEDRMHRAIYLTPFPVRLAMSMEGTPEAKGKADYVMDLVAQINKGQSYTIGMAKSLSRIVGRLSKQRRELHEVLATATVEELNFILLNVTCAAFVEVCSHMTMEMLTQRNQRLPELDVLAKAALLDALQKVGMRYRFTRQTWACSLLLGTRGLEMTRLKSYLDDGGDHHTMFKLVYNDLQGDVQRDVLQHVSTEGHRALREFHEGVPNAPPGVVLKIVSDIDDTLMCSGGSWPAGRDMRLPKKCVYPGALALYSELDIGYGVQLKACRQMAELRRTREASAAPEAPSTQARQQQQQQQQGSRSAHLRKQGEGLLGRLKAGLAGLTDGAQDDPPTPGADVESFSGDLGSSPPSDHLDSMLSRQRSSRVGSSRNLADGHRSMHQLRRSFSIDSSRGSTGTAADSDEDAQPAWGSGILGTTAGEELGLTDAPDRDSVVQVMDAGREGDPLTAVITNLPLRASMQGALASASELVQAARRGAAQAMRQPMSALETLRRPSRESLRPATGGEAQQMPSPQRESDPERPHQEGVNLAFLSARPESVKGLTEFESFRLIFNPLLKRKELFCTPVLLLGSLNSAPKALASWFMGGRVQREAPNTLNTQLYAQLANRKLARFREFAALYPECCWVFLGDNGQGDVLFAEALTHILVTPDGQSRLLASFMNIAVPLEETVSTLRTEKSNEASWLMAWRSRSIHLHHTHVGMAVQAHILGLIDDIGLQRVAVSACNDLRWARARYAQERISWHTVVTQLNQDIMAANDFLPEHMQVTSIRLPDGPSTSPERSSRSSAFWRRVSVARPSRQSSTHSAPSGELPQPAPSDSSGLLHDNSLQGAASSSSDSALGPTPLAPMRRQRSTLDKLPDNVTGAAHEFSRGRRAVRVNNSRSFGVGSLQ